MNDQHPLSITEFKGGYFYLSNFYHSWMRYLGFACPTSEHAFQLAKATSYADMLHIARADTPREAKRRGRQVELRPDWEQVKLIVMQEVVTLKFTSNPIIRMKLLGTDNVELIEGNHWGDTYWGKDSKTGAGANHLGQILMGVRSLLQKR